MFFTTRLRNTLLLAVVGLTALLAVNATQVMHRPDNYKDAPRNGTVGHPTPHVVHKRATAHANSAYFTNWYVSSLMPVFQSAHSNR